MIEDDLHKLEVDPHNQLSAVLAIIKKLDEVILVVNEITWRERARNRQTHINVEKVGDGELLYCKDCHGGEVELWDATCRARQGLDTI